MNMRLRRETNNKILVDVNELQAMLSVGKNTAIKIGNESGAVVKIGNRKLYNVQTIEEYVKQLMGE